MEVSNDLNAVQFLIYCNELSVASRYGNRTAVLVALVAPSPHSIQPRIPSLLQAILYCDAQAVELILEALAKERGKFQQNTLSYCEAVCRLRQTVADCRFIGGRVCVYMHVLLCVCFFFAVDSASV